MKYILLISIVLSSASLFAQSKKPKQATRAIVARAKSGSSVVQAEPGLAVYKQYCLTCHQVNGSGVPGLNPPLRGTEWVNGDKARLIGVLLNGLQNAEVEGETYDNVMPAHDFLTDAQIADVLTYVRSNFGNKASAITADEVTAQRAAKK
ncbi:c-type cytochrome [Fibrella aquatilis]|uniref:Cytochrome c n=1 Tax=Fibrella aquatilis TaxID=2817059 RepID=A0A939K0N1_9BACT|nr:cytochrome c [Fibrella aquatilis]MBO0932186.1 cytochrome c [Fibrella aquatilis]